MKYSTSVPVPHPTRRDKSDATRRRKSLLADGDLLQDLQASGYFEHIDGKPSSVVYAPIDLITSESVGQQTKTPKQLRDVDPALFALFCHVALKKHHNHVWGFTLKLSKEIEGKARAQGKHCRRYLTKRIKEEIGRSLKRAGLPYLPVLFWFALEEDDRGVLHVHGAIAFEPWLKETVRAGLKTAGGKWEQTGRGYAEVRFETNPDIRWAGYCLKDYHKARPSRRKHFRHIKGRSRFLLASFDGPAIAASPELRKLVPPIYADAVASAISYRTAATFIPTIIHSGSSALYAER